MTESGAHEQREGGDEVRCTCHGASEWRRGSVFGEQRVERPLLELERGPGAESVGKGTRETLGPVARRVCERLPEWAARRVGSWRLWTGGRVGLETRAIAEAFEPRALQHRQHALQMVEHTARSRLVLHSVSLTHCTSTCALIRITITITIARIASISRLLVPVSLIKW